MGLIKAQRHAVQTPVLKHQLVKHRPFGRQSIRRCQARVPRQQGAVLLQHGKQDQLGLIKQNCRQLLGIEIELEPTMRRQLDMTGHQVGVVGQRPVIGLLGEITRHRNRNARAQHPGQRQRQQDVSHQPTAQQGL